MTVSGVARFGFTASMMVVGIALQGIGAQAQQRGGTVRTDECSP